MAKKNIKKSKLRLMIFGTASIFVISYFCFTLFSYLYNYSSLKKEEKKLNENLIILQEKKQELKTEIVKLNDPDYIIRYAKENYLYSSNGEYVIKLDEKKQEEVLDKENNDYIVYIILVIFIISLITLFIKRKNTSK